MTDAEADPDRPVRIEERPAPEEAAAVIESALAGVRAASVVARCGVEGADRDGSPPAVRHVLVKPDGTVLIHAGTGASPDVRLTGAGADDVAPTEGGIRIDARLDERRRRLRLSRIAFVAGFAVDETTGPGQERRGTIRESDDRHGAIRQRLLAEPDRLEAGFRPLATERETPAGPVDLYGRDAEGRHVVVEIKAHRAGPAAVGQLDRYVSALRRDLHAEATVRGVLVAPSATGRTRRLLRDGGFEFRRIDPEA